MKTRTVFAIWLAVMVSACGSEVDPRPNEFDPIAIKSEEIGAKLDEIDSALKIGDEAGAAEMFLTLNPPSDDVLSQRYRKLKLDLLSRISAAEVASIQGSIKDGTERFKKLRQSYYDLKGKWGQSEKLDQLYEMAVLEAISPLPSSNLEANFEGYRFLAFINSENSEYQAKSDKYEKAWKDYQLAPLDPRTIVFEIVAVEEDGEHLNLSIETNIPTPFEIMAGVSLRGQRDDDVWIGNNKRFKIRSETQVLKIRASQNNKRLPSGQYDAEIHFYPKWGAKSAPDKTKTISKELSDRRGIRLKGSGVSAAAVAKQNERQQWVMLNVNSGMIYNHSAMTRRLGPSEAYKVSNRNEHVIARYFKEADMTIFVNTLTGTVVTWRKGLQTRV